MHLIWRLRRLSPRLNGAKEITARCCNSTREDDAGWVIIIYGVLIESGIESKEIIYHLNLYVHACLSIVIIIFSTLFSLLCLIAHTVVVVAYVASFSCFLCFFSSIFLFHILFLNSDYIHWGVSSLSTSHRSIDDRGLPSTRANTQITHHMETCPCCFIHVSWFSN